MAGDAVAAAAIVGACLAAPPTTSSRGPAVPTTVAAALTIPPPVQPLPPALTPASEWAIGKGKAILATPSRSRPEEVDGVAPGRGKEGHPRSSSDLSGTSRLASAVVATPSAPCPPSPWPPINFPVPALGSTPCTRAPLPHCASPTTHRAIQRAYWRAPCPTWQCFFIPQNPSCPAKRSPPCSRAP